MDELKLKEFSLDNYGMKTVFKDKDYLNLLSKVKLIDNGVILESVDKYHIYQNDEKVTYAYDTDGFIYEFHNGEMLAELIDCYDIENERG